MLEEQAVSNQGHGSSANVRMAIEVYWQKAMSISQNNQIVWSISFKNIFFVITHFWLQQGSKHHVSSIAYLVDVNFKRLKKSLL